MKELLSGFKDYLNAGRLVQKDRLWPLVMVPGLIGLLYFPAIVLLTLSWGGDVSGYLRDRGLPESFNYKWVVWLLAVAIWIAGVFIGFVLFRNGIMILYAPVLAILSRQTELKAYPGQILSETEVGIVQSALRGSGMSLLSLLLSLGSLAVCVPLLFIPLVGQLAIAVWLPLTQMFLAGHGFIDPTLERRGYSVRESFRFVWRHRLRTLGCGGGFMLLTAVPVLGWFLGPTLGVVAGTLNAVNLLRMGKTPGRRDD
jgi:uncharacterized protein involved in cysteine biosynthesis